MAFMQTNFYSNTLNRTVTFNAIIPSDREIGDSEQIRPYQTLYLLHGAFGNCSDWIHYTRIQKLAEQFGVAVIMPSGENSFYTDNLRSNQLFGQFIGEELVEQTRKMFNLSHQREDTFIAGLSMGGYGALRNGLQYYRTFSQIGAFSSAIVTYIMEEQLTGQSATSLSPQFFENIFGPYEQVVGSSNDLESVIVKLKQQQASLPRLYVACGTEDFLYQHNVKFKNFLIQHQIDHLYEESSGGHDWVFWDEYIEKFLQWLPLRKHSSLK